MVLLAAAVLTKGGKVLLSRQFVEMTKSRVEGLLAAFPKLIPAGKQHTFVETDAVRYVYQPMEKLYMVLITTKASNILEDLETLRLFAKVVPEYSKTLDENDVCDNAFNIIFAFDEIVALGYRESVNLAQIRTFVDMDSHEEKVYQAVRQSQEQEAKRKMRERAKQLQRDKLEAAKRGIRPSGNSYSMSSTNYSSSGPSITQDSPMAPPAESRPSSYSKPSGPSKALKLGGKSSKDVEYFVDQLKSEGEVVGQANVGGLPKSSSTTSAPAANTESVHLKVEEKINVTAGRDGGLQNMEVIGLVTLRVQDENSGYIRIAFQNEDARGIQFQTHPNVDKELFRTRNQIGLKNPQKPFPVNTDVGVLKWRYQTKDEQEIPLTINCWPSDNGKGGCDVNIEYELLNEDLELLDLIVAIPVPPGSGAPVVGECEGEYLYDSRRNQLLWQLAVVDSSNKTGALEFSISNGKPGQFFPVEVTFQSFQSFAKLSVTEVNAADSGAPVKYSVESQLIAEAGKYQVV